jgi:hypothetical protein
MQCDLASLEKWATTWGMRFNPKKCYTMRISRSTKPLTKFYMLMQHALEQVPHSQYLGVTISDNLKWEAHINRVCQKGNQLLGFLRRNLKYSPKTLKETAYKSLVRCNLEYCSSIWDPYYTKDIKQLEQVQRRAARFVHRDYSWESSVSTMIAELGWDSLQSRRKDARLTLFYKVVNGAVGVNAEAYLTKGYTRTRASNSSKFRQIQATSTQYSNSFFVRTIPEWNNLPGDTTNLQTAKLFRDCLSSQRRD